MAYPNEIFEIKLNNTAIQGNIIWNALGMVPEETGLMRKLGLIIQRSATAGQTIKFIVTKRQKIKKVKNVPYVTQTETWAQKYDAITEDVTFKPGYYWAASGDEQSKELFLLTGAVQAHVFGKRIMERGRYEDIHYAKLCHDWLQISANKAKNVVEITTADLTQIDDAKAIKLYETLIGLITKIRKVSNELTASLGDVEGRIKILISPELRAAFQMALFKKAINPKYILDNGAQYMTVDGIKMYVTNVLGLNHSYSDLVSVDLRKLHCLLILDLGPNNPAVIYQSGKNYAKQAEDPMMAGLFHASFRGSEGAKVWSELAKFSLYGIYTT